MLRWYAGSVSECFRRILLKRGVSTFSHNDVGHRYNTQLFRCYADFDTRVRPVIFAVKEWANRRKIKDASVGFLSSYSFVLMVIYFLQMGVSPPILPHLQSEELTKTTSNIFVIDHGDESGATATAHPRTVIAGFDCTFCGNADAARALLAAKHNSANTMTVGELLGIAITR